MDIKTIDIIDIFNFLDLKKISYEFVNEKSVKITGFCPLIKLTENSITWIRKKYKIPIEDLNRFKNILLFAEKGTWIEGLRCPVVFVENVHRTFFRVTEYFFDGLNPEKKDAKIERTAVVETTKIGNEVYIGHHTYISDKVVVGNNVTIMHNVTIDGSVEIGDNSFIESGSVIGACGFGYMTNEEGKREIVPHYGGVKIGKNVRIGANNTIIRGCLSDTIIEDDVKTADLVCISHNDIIKQGVMITCGVTIAGSTVVGENTWIAPGVTINDNVTIGEEAWLGIGSVIATKIRNKKKVFGNPAKYID